jgi:hypothetical protein
MRVIRIKQRPDGYAYLVRSVWRDTVNGSTSYETPGGNKHYLRVWDHGPREWSWILNQHAERKA